MKKNIGSTLALYPTPAVIVGTMTNGKANWVLVGHLGIIGHDCILISLHKSHFSNIGIRQTQLLSVNIIDEQLLPRADYIGIVSGKKVDKSDVFDWFPGDVGMPVIKESPLIMECEVIDNYETETFNNFICKILNTYVEEEVLNEKGKVDYDKLKPILFEMPTYSYFKTGERIAPCTSLGKVYKEQAK